MVAAPVGNYDVDFTPRNWHQDAQRQRPAHGVG
jgi:hypothetical protein